MGLNNGFVDLSARFVGLNNGFVSLNNGFVNLNARFVDLNNGFVDLDRGFVDPKRYFYKKATDLIRPPARILRPHPSPLPKEREQEVLAPFSLGRRVGEGLPHFVRRAVQIHARGLLRRSSEQTSTRSIALLKVYEV